MIIMHGGSYDNFHAPYWPIIKNKETMNQKYSYIIINEEHNYFWADVKCVHNQCCI